MSLRPQHVLSNWKLTQLSWMTKTKFLSFEEIKILSDVDNAVVFYAHEISFGTISSCLLQIGIFKELARIWRKVIILNQIFFLKRPKLTFETVVLRKLADRALSEIFHIHRFLSTLNQLQFPPHFSIAFLQNYNKHL